MDPAATIPALPPPPGVTPNFVNPESRASTILIVGVISSVLMVLTVMLRMYSKIWITCSLWWDDAASILAMGGALGSTLIATSLLDVIGPHQWDVPASYLTAQVVQKTMVGLGLLYAPTALFAKLALLLLYLRMFSVSRRTRYMIQFGIVCNVAFYTGIFIFMCAVYPPRSGQSWLEAVSTDYFRRVSTTSSLIQGFFNVASDIYLFVLPMPVLWKLQLPLRKKIGLSTVFMAGLLVCISSVMYLYYRLSSTDDPDSTWILMPIWTMAIIEVNVGTICGCMPYLPAIYKHHRARCAKLGALRNVPARVVSKVANRPCRMMPKQSTVHDDASANGLRLAPNEIYVETEILKSVGGSEEPWQLRDLP